MACIYRTIINIFLNVKEITLIDNFRKLDSGIGWGLFLIFHYLLTDIIPVFCFLKILSPKVRQRSRNSIEKNLIKKDSNSFENLPLSSNQIIDA